MNSHVSYTRQVNVNGCRATTRAASHGRRANFARTRSNFKNLQAAAGGCCGLRLIFSDFALEKSLLPFHVSGGRCAMEGEREAPVRPITNPSSFLRACSLIPNEMAKICFTRVSPCSSFKAGSLKCLRTSRNTCYSQYTVHHALRCL